MQRNCIYCKKLQFYICLTYYYACVEVFDYSYPTICIHTYTHAYGNNAFVYVFNLLLLLLHVCATYYYACVEVFDCS